MSFLKIKDPSKRDKLVAEYLKTKKKIQDDFRSERLGEQSLHEDFGKIVEPITEQQQKSSEEIVSKFASLQEAIENMPAQQALPWDMPQPEALAELDTPQIKLDETLLAGEYLEKYSQKEGGADETFGIRREKGKYCMGRKRVIIDKDSNLFVDGKTYEGTQGLWELIVKNKPETGVYDDNDVINYKKIIKTTGAMINLKDPQKPAGSSQGYKWINFIQPIWEKHSQEQKQEAERQKKEAKRQKQEVKLQKEKNTKKGLSPKRP